VNRDRVVEVEDDDDDDDDDDDERAGGGDRVASERGQRFPVLYL
jgi:hypothetical protein